MNYLEYEKVQEICQKYLNNGEIVENLPEFHKLQVCLYFTQELNQLPPKEYHFEHVSMQYGITVAIAIATYVKQIPPKEWYHDPYIQDSSEDTVATSLAKNGIIPPEEWYHDPLIHNEEYDTVAICLARNGIIPPKEWRHSPYIKNVDGETVQSLLQKKKIEVTPEWQFINAREIQRQLFNGIVIDDQLLNTIELKYINEVNKIRQKIINEQFIKKKDVCTICLQSGEQNFIKTECYPYHLICENCWKQIIKTNRKCPVCRKEKSLPCKIKFENMYIPKIHKKDLNLEESYESCSSFGEGDYQRQIFLINNDSSDSSDSSDYSDD